MPIPFNNGEFVCSRESLNYQSVLDDFKNAELSPAEGRLPIFVTLRRLFFAEYR